MRFGSLRDSGTRAAADEVEFALLCGFGDVTHRRVCNSLAVKRHCSCHTVRFLVICDWKRFQVFPQPESDIDVNTDRFEEF
jgi:hypothetical protein